MRKIKLITIASVVLSLALVVSGCGETKSTSTTPTPTGVKQTSETTQNPGQINHGEGDVYSCLVCHNKNANVYPRADNPNKVCMTCHSLLLGVTSKPLKTIGVVGTAGVVTHPSYSKDVQPILQSECGTCHIDTTYATTIKRINAEKPENKLMDRINGVTRPVMPAPGKLRKNQVQTITNWVNDGAKNN